MKKKLFTIMLLLLSFVGYADDGVSSFEQQQIALTRLEQHASSVKLLALECQANAMPNITVQSFDKCDAALEEFSQTQQLIPLVMPLLKNEMYNTSANQRMDTIHKDLTAGATAYGLVALAQHINIRK
jgi:hypothetical protein